MGYKKNLERVGLQDILSEAILLPEDEKIISVWPGMRCTLNISSNRFDKYPSLLYLTNKRLIWIQKKLFNFDLPLEDITSFLLVEWKIQGVLSSHQERGISIKSTSRNIDELIEFKIGSPTGKIQSGKYPFTFETIKKTVEKTTQNRRKEIQQAKKRIQVILNFSSLKKTIEKGELIMTTFKCPSCNAMLPIPDHGKLLICEYCNAPIKATDIFEKIKTLLE
jgi:hypothetical protein